ncbi:MAG: polymerase, partial [Clostridiales bacterium]|nr:polymerase [Clostridiales bacterium]
LPIKGIGNSTTIAFDVTDKKTACMVLLSLTETVAMRLRDVKKCAYVISVSLKDNTFKSYSHQKKLDVPTDSTNIIYKKVQELFDEMWKGEPIRHMGIHLSGLYSNDFYQLSLLEPDSEKYKYLDKAIDRIRLKYGPNSVMRSCFLHSGLKPLMGGVLYNTDYPMMSSIL